MRAIAAALMAVLFSLCEMLPAEAAPRLDGCISYGCWNPVKTTSDGYRYTYDAATRSFIGRTEFKAKQDPRARYDTQYVIDCGQPQPPDAPATFDNGLDCAGAQCTIGPDNGRWMIVWSKQVAPVFDIVYTQIGRFCDIIRPPIPLADVITAVHEDIRKHFKPAVPVIQPAQNTLVNFPNIISTTDAGPQSFPITQPLPGTVNIHPTYTWTYTGPDGAQGNATGVGTPYDGTSPRTGPPDYYLTATFRHSGTGTITLTVTWEGTVTVGTNAPVDLDALVFDQTADLLIEQRRAVLLDPHVSN